MIKIISFLLLITIVNAMDFEEKSTASNDSHPQGSSVQQPLKPRVFLDDQEIQNVPDQLNRDFWLGHASDIWKGKYKTLRIENYQLDNERFAQDAEFNFLDIEIINCPNFNLEGLKNILGSVVSWEGLLSVTLKNTSVKKEDKDFQNYLKEIKKLGGPEIVIEE